MKIKRPLPQTIACTIVAQNYLGRADVLARSFKKFHPNIPFFILVIDDLNGESKRHWKSVDAPIFVISDLEAHFTDQLDHSLREMLFPYDVMEASTSVKPIFFRFLFEKLTAEKLLFLDPDTMLFGPLDDVFNKLDDYSVVLTPHLVRFSNLEDNLNQEKQISLSGVFNLGFLGLKRCEENDKFLKWWGERLYKHCLRRAKEGIFTDQKWIDMAFGALSNVFVFRDIGVNVAHWNLHERPLWRNKKMNFFVEDKPLRLFHFSGFEETQTEKLTKYSDFKLIPNSPISNLVKIYLQELKFSQNQKFLKLPFGLNYFSNGIEIPSVLKLAWSEYKKMPTFADPFNTEGANSFFKWLFLSSHGHLNNFLMIMYFLRSDLQRSFDLKTGLGCAQFLEWYREFGYKDYNLDPRFQTLLLLSLGNYYSKEKVRSL